MSSKLERMSKRATHTADTAVGDGNLDIVVLHGLALEVDDLEVGPASISILPAN